MGYISLYRKYRSQTFDDVVGQDHVTRTLQNAIKSERIGHAYLFCGSRGTGKTSVARLLAKAVNCVNGPSTEPCNECDACVSISLGQNVDVVEMDAASHRGIDDVKELRDDVKYPPMSLRYKVYIIDEAHQLSKDAKDAFLKTLEEPPAHAIFVLATTEAHMIPATIRSRCQQFDFRRGSLADISGRLKYVCDKEGVKIDDDALELLAKNAGGSWRDALSVLEQVLAYTEHEVTAKDVSTVLGSLDLETLFEVSDILSGRDAAKAFELADRLISEGKDVRELLRSITGHFRDLLHASVGLSTGGEYAARYKEQAEKFSKSRLIWLVEAFAAAEKEMRWNDQHRLVLELTMLKAVEGPRSAAQPAAAAPEAQETASAPPPPRPAQPRSEPPAARTTPAPPSVERQKPEMPRVETPKPEMPKRQAPEPERAEQPQVDSPAMDEIVQNWGRVLRKLRETNNKSIETFLKEGRPMSLDDGCLTIAFSSKFQFAKSKLEDTRNQQPIRAAIQAVLGKDLKLRATLVEPGEMTRYPTVQAAEDPNGGESGLLVDDVLSIFGGEIVEQDNSWEEG